MSWLDEMMGGFGNSGSGDWLSNMMGGNGGNGGGWLNAMSSMAPEWSLGGDPNSYMNMPMGTFASYKNFQKDLADYAQSYSPGLTGWANRTGSALIGRDVPPPPTSPFFRGAPPDSSIPTAITGSKRQPLPAIQASPSGPVPTQKPLETPTVTPTATPARTDVGPTVTPTPTPAATAFKRSTNAQENVQHWVEVAKPIAEQYGVPLDLVLAIIHFESGGNPDAQSKPNPGSSNNRAQGLMQVMPSHWGVQGYANDQQTAPMRDPAENIAKGTAFLRQLYDMFGDWNTVSWKYFTGPGGVPTARDVNGTSGNAYERNIRALRALYAGL